MSPAEPDGDGHRAGGGGRPATFEDIVAGWRAEGGVPSWPSRLDECAGRPDAALPETGRPEPPPSPPVPDEDHFVPPEPPPMPRLGRQAAVGLALLATGLLLMIAPELLGLADSVGMTLGLLMMAGGLGWLVLRSWPADPPSGGDDGAVL